MNYKAFKDSLLAHLFEILEQRVDRLLKEIEDTRESLASEARSTAGDKHQTARAMAHLEQEKLGSQLKESQKLLRYLNALPQASVSDSITVGKLIITTDSWYYLTIGIGSLNFEGKNVNVVSPASPIGQKLITLKKGDILEFNKIKSQITEVI